MYYFVDSSTVFLTSMFPLADAPTKTGHSAANAVARIGSITAPFLIEGKSSLLQKGFVMLAIHSITVICVSQLPETKGSHFGRGHGEDGDDHELALTEEISNEDSLYADDPPETEENTTHHQIT